MTFPKVRLVVSLCLFLGWIGFLLFLVWRAPTSILSRPQFLLASLYVVADVTDHNGKAAPEVTLVELLWSANSINQKLAGKKIVLADLPLYKAQQGYIGAGKYLLPLLEMDNLGKKEYLVAPLPAIQGYSPHILLGTVQLKEIGKNEVVLPSLAASMVGLLSPAGQGPNLTAYVLYPVRVSNQENIVRILVASGRKKEDAEALLNQFARHDPLVVARRWPLREAYQLDRKLAAVGTSAEVIAEEVRIYPWTPQTQGQVMEIIKAKQ